MSVNDNRTLFRVLAPSLRRWTWEASSVYVLSSLSEIDCFAGCLFCQSAEVTSIDSSCCCGVATLVALSWPNTERGFNALGVAEDVIFSCRLELLSSVAAPADTTGVDVALPSPSKRKSSSTCAMNGCLCKMSNEKTPAQLCSSCITHKSQHKSGCIFPYLCNDNAVPRASGSF